MPPHRCIATAACTLKRIPGLRRYDLRETPTERFDAIRLDTRIESADEDDRQVQAVLRGPDGGDEQSTFDRVLIAFGRRPNIEDLGLDAAGVDTDDDGHIRIDREQRTSAENILAIGDVTGGTQLAQEAMHAGKVAAEVIAGRPAAFDARAVPAVIYTDPQIAWCGLTETDAERHGRDVEVARFPWRASGRALTIGAADGLTKLVLASDTGKVLGFGAVGRGAEGLVAEAVLAIEMGALAEDLALVIHPHPTLSETVGEAAQRSLGLPTHPLPDAEQQPQRRPPSSAKRLSSLSPNSRPSSARPCSR